jgi:hypothetical protein
MSEKLERRFSSWEEFSQEFSANLKNFGLFLPGPRPVQLRQKVTVDLYLPGERSPIPTRAEVVAVFPAGVALHLEEGPEWMKAVEGKMPATSSEPAPAPAAEAEPEPAAGEGEGAAAEEAVSAKEKAELAALDSEPVSDEKVQEIEKKITLKGMDMGNLYQAIRKLSKIEKIQLAKRGNRKALSILIQQGDRLLFRFLIQNPHMTMAEVLQLFKHPMITTEIITELARNPSWSQNEELRYQMVMHPKTPLPTALTLLNALNQRQLAALAKSQSIRAQIKSNALKLLLKRQSGNL